MNIVICDDDNIYRKRLEYAVCGMLINKNSNSEIVLVTDDPNEVLKYIHEEKTITLYILDIALGNVSGFDIAAHIRRTDDISPIVFITNYSEHMELTYEYKVRAFDFIVKSDEKECLKKIEKCIELVEQRQGSGYTKCINIHNYSTNFSVQYDNIYYIDTVPGKHKLVLHTETAQYEFYGKINELIKELDDSFFKCHKSVIVNKEKIIGVNKKDKVIILKNGYTCSYSNNLFKPNEIHEYKRYN